MKKARVNFRTIRSTTTLRANEWRSVARSALVAALGLAVVALAGPAWVQAASHREIRITSSDIGRLPVGKNYFVDLTRRGVIYDFDSTARPIDFTRVTVRTAKGDVAMETWLKGQFPRIAASRWRSGHLRIGDAKKFRSVSGRRPPLRAPSFTCDGNRCDCHGDDDCNDMFGSGVCGQIASCTPEDCSCLRFP